MSNSDIKVLIVVPTLSGGGAERVASIWANGLQRYTQCLLLCLYPVQNEYFLSNNVLRHNLYESETKYRLAKNVEKIRLLRNYLKKEKPDIIIPLVAYMGITCNIARLGLKIKIIETIRNNPQLTPREIGWRILRNISVKLSNGCIVQNEEQKKYFRNNKNFLVLGNPINEKFYNCIKQYHKVPSKLVAIGRLHPQKNFFLLLHSFEKIIKEFPDLTLEIYGEGEQRKILESYIYKAGLTDKVKLMGHSNDIIKVLETADIFILSSDYEGMPNALMEALAVGVPCIATNCPTGPADLIQNHITGALVPMRDEWSLCKAMKTYILQYNTAVENGKRARIKMKIYREDRIVYLLYKYILNIVYGSFDGE